MPKSKNQKTQIIEQIKGNIEKAKSLVFTDYRGLKVKDLQQLRKNLKAQAGKFEVVKINLAKRAFSEAGAKKFIDIVGKASLAFAYGLKDELSTPKEIKKFAKINPNLKILGGFYQGNFLTKEQIERLADISSKEELLVKLLVTLNSPAYGLAFALNGLAPRLVRTLKAIGEKGA